MDRIPLLQADRFKSVGYDIPNHLLELELADGSLRQYKKIEQEVYERLIHAEPPESYFDEKIAGQYEEQANE